MSSIPTIPSAISSPGDAAWRSAITARTGDLSTSVWNTDKNSNPDDDDFEDSVTKVEADVDGVVKGKAYKVVFFPNPAARAGQPLKPVGMTVNNPD